MSGLKTETAWSTNVVSIADFKLFAELIVLTHQKRTH